MSERSLLHRLSTEDLADAWVSPYSRWSDDYWQFEPLTAGTQKTRYKIVWNFAVSKDHNFTEARYSGLLESWKRVIWCLFAEPGDGRYRKFINSGNLTTTLKFAVQWMVSERYDDLSRINPLALDRFIDHLAQRKVSSRLLRCPIGLRRTARRRSWKQKHDAQLTEKYARSSLEDWGCCNKAKRASSHSDEYWLY